MCELDVHSYCMDVKCTSIKIYTIGEKFEISIFQIYSYQLWKCARFVIHFHMHWMYMQRCIISTAHIVADENQPRLYVGQFVT